MKNTVVTFKQAKEKGEKLTMLTAYDYSTAKLIDEAGINAILVGDSLGMVVLGYEDTLSVTMEAVSYTHLDVYQRQVYKHYDAYVAASQSEGFGLTLMEAIGSGLPIVEMCIRDRILIIRRRLLWQIWVQ